MSSVPTPDAASLPPPPGTYLDEIKQLFRLHAKAQGVPARRCDRILGRITAVEGPGPTAWPGAWSRTAEVYAASGSHLDACRYYNAARFPFVADAHRARALERCVEEFGHWARGRGVERLTVPIGEVEVPVWAAPPEPGRPLLVVTGGIVSIKEQWGQLLPAARRLGMTAVVAELPSVGENPLPYGRESWRMFPALIDFMAHRARTSHTVVLAFSFGGHLALRAAAHDRRIRGIATVGPPVWDFFRDRAWWNEVPWTTKATLAHLVDIPPEQLPSQMGDWGIGPDELAEVSADVYSVASRRDEIIPRGDVARLRSGLRRVEVLEHDDVHGSPHHLGATRLWLARSMLLAGGAHGWRPRALEMAAAALSRLEAWRRPRGLD
ncbi:hypothetical protein RIF23_11460 [Lipingzhangella sp. LS1_29]|uniref:Alpha/beta hydrolase family protein DUF1100 n=1 Tax=Lipingzhangella rawalii TaxID=2055835 RepID=A0ABU2H6J5_9ACTN|nr:hypothetical protein [Lipingzhangella rawalii]MDS1270916.1 hypothetical protein [Lipingzhangella rawalii]